MNITCRFILILKKYVQNRKHFLAKMFSICHILITNENDEGGLCLHQLNITGEFGLAVRAMWLIRVQELKFNNRQIQTGNKVGVV